MFTQLNKLFSIFLALSFAFYGVFVGVAQQICATRLAQIELAAEISPATGGSCSDHCGSHGSSDAEQPSPAADLPAGCCTISPSSLDGLSASAAVQCPAPALTTPLDLPVSHLAGIPLIKLPDFRNVPLCSRITDKSTVLRV